MRVAACVGLALLLVGCGGQTPSERKAYEIACEALHADTSLPEGVVPVAIDEAQLHVGKSAGWVVLPYAYPGGDGGTAMGQATVQLIRVERVWQQAPERMGRR